MRLAYVEARFEFRTSKTQSRIGNGSTKVLVGGSADVDVLAVVSY
jgi:hypothetical protein